MSNDNEVGRVARRVEYEIRGGYDYCFSALIVCYQSLIFFRIL